jgi:hypothetical protein
LIGLVERLGESDKIEYVQLPGVFCLMLGPGVVVQVVTSQMLVKVL